MFAGGRECFRYFGFCLEQGGRFGETSAEDVFWAVGFEQQLERQVGAAFRCAARRIEKRGRVAQRNSAKVLLRLRQFRERGFVAKVAEQ